MNFTINCVNILQLNNNKNDNRTNARSKRQTEQLFYEYVSEF